MANLNTVTCEICRIIKSEANHWWTAYALQDEQENPAGVLVVPFDVTTITWPFRRKLPKPSAHLCGQAHVQKWIEGQLDRSKRGVVRQEVTSADTVPK